MMMALGGQQNQRAARSSSSRAASSSQATSSDKKEEMAIQKYLTDCRSFYSCLSCRAHLANHDELISRSFQGNRSRAYLFNKVINITTGQPVQRELNTGSHAVADIFCSNCGTTIGWKYERAYVDSQKYKEGKFIIELAHVVRENRHLELDKRDMFLGLQTSLHRTQPALSTAVATTTTHDTIENQTTIGELHRGSLSPPSHSGHSRWSSATSSSSSNEDNGSPPARLHTRINDNYEESSDEAEEEEVLMFPFHDDLYGERASYSSSSASRLSYTKRSRRSMRQDSAPYDWKYSTRVSTSLNLGEARVEQTSSTSLPTPLGDSVLSGAQVSSQPLSTSASATNATTQAGSFLSSAYQAPVGLARSEQDDRDQDIQFKMDPCEPSVSSSTQNCDQSMGNNLMLGQEGNSLSRIGARKSSPSESNVDQAVNDDDNDYDDYEPSKRAGVPQATGSGSQMSTDSSRAPDMDTNLTRTNSLSLDDEEFYDCCTDHQVSN